VSEKKRGYICSDTHSTEDESGTEKKTEETARRHNSFIDLCKKTQLRIRLRK